MCWVIPPASPAATLVRRMKSSSEVLPWSTWPMTVTTGGRGFSSAAGCSSLSVRYASGSSSLAALALWPISSTTMIPVSWSSTWLMVAMVPSFISALITSAAFTDMRCASSPTVMVSGTATSRTSGSVGWAKVVGSPLGAERCPPRPRECQPPTPPPESPRVLIWRRRTESSRSTVVVFAFLGFLSVLASPVAGFGACSVVAGVPAGADAASAAAFCSASLRSRSCFSRSSAACSSASCCWRRASSSRSAISFRSTVGAAGAGGGGGGVSAATAWAATSAGSRLTNTRFLRTSTCTVRYLPVESVFLISCVCLRVSVILFFCSAEPCILRRYSSSRDLSCSESESSGCFLSTPAARSCSSSTDGGTFSSLANWATLVCATLRGLLVFEPVGARRHDQLLGAVCVHAGDLGQLVDRQIGEVVARLHALLHQLGGELRVHAVELEHLGVDALHLLFVGDRGHQQRVARAVAQLVHRILVERLDLVQLGDRHVGDLFHGGEALLDQDVGHFLVDVELLHEVLLDAPALLLLLLGRLFLGHQVDLPPGELGGEAHVLPAAADGNREVLLVDHHVHRM